MTHTNSFRSIDEFIYFKRKIKNSVFFFHGYKQKYFSDDIINYKFLNFYRIKKKEKQFMR
jgi:hypothetical protein